jgi:hypothetical protein
VYAYAYAHVHGSVDEYMILLTVWLCIRMVLHTLIRHLQRLLGQLGIICRVLEHIVLSGHTWGVSIDDLGEEGWWKGLAILL